MAGPATFARDADVASQARDLLDEAAVEIALADAAQRRVLHRLIGLWPTSAWLAAGAASAKQWLRTYTCLSYPEAKRLESIAELCAGHPELAEAVVSGALTLGRADRLATLVTQEREPFLAEILPDLLALAAETSDDDAFVMAVRYWADRVDEHLSPRRVQPHSLTMAPSLFGGGTVIAHLGPNAYANVHAAVDAWTQDPDPKDAPYVRTLSERRADALDDLARDSLLRSADDEGDLDEAPDPIDEEIRANDTFDGSYPGDGLDEALDLAEESDEPVDPLVVLRRRLQRTETHRRRRIRRKTRPRSHTQVNVIVDVRTLPGVRDGTDLDDLILRGDGWSLTERALSQYRCDASFVLTLTDGRTKVMDANTASERFSRAQRRALAARDGHCVFPSCTRLPRHCDAHHLHHRAHHGPTEVANGALLCRFHHRLIHEYGWNLLVDDTGHWIAIDPHLTVWTGRAAAPESRARDRPTDQDPA